MKTLVSIYCHNKPGAVEAFERHFQYWQELGHDILLFSPSDAAVSVAGISGITTGKAQHHGVQSIKNFRGVLEHMAGLGYDRHAFFEYDSICLGPLPEFKGDLAAIIYHDSNPGFTGKMFCHPPILFTASGLNRLVEEFKQMPFDAEQGFWDRWIGLAIERAGLVYTDLLTDGRGWSRNTIYEVHHKDLFNAILRGVKVIHGIKDQQTLEVIQRAWKKKVMIEQVQKLDPLEEA